jgi:glutamine amidotransferase
VPGVVTRLPGGQKVPQIGWNQVRFAPQHAAHPLFADIPDRSDFYFVHSYYCDLTDQQTIAGTTDYGLAFPSVLLRDNLAAVQFHPEKSGKMGLRLLHNFVTWASQQTTPAAPTTTASQ